MELRQIRMKLWKTSVTCRCGCHHQLAEHHTRCKKCNISCNRFVNFLKITYYCRYIALIEENKALKKIISYKQIYPTYCITKYIIMKLFNSKQRSKRIWSEVYLSIGTVARNLIVCCSLSFQQTVLLIVETLHLFWENTLQTK